jgi:hypothetical protein
MSGADSEGVIDPWVAEWFAANPERAAPFEELVPELLELARGPVGMPSTRDVAEVRDDDVDGVPVRVYRNEGTPTGLLVYFHGGGFVMGSIGIMDNVARELAHATDRGVGRVPPRTRTPLPRRARRLRESHPVGARARGELRGVARGRGSRR